jgi:hypothetical protein
MGGEALAKENGGALLRRHIICRSGDPMDQKR